MNRALWLRRLPWSIVVLAILLMLLGWLGIARSETLWSGSGRYFHRQVFWTPVSLLGMLAVSIPSYKLLSRWSYAAFLTSLVLLVVVYWFPPVNGAQRWIRF